MSVIKVFAKERMGLVDFINFLKRYTSEIHLFMGRLGDQLPKEAYEFECDYLFSYSSPWIIPKEVLNKTKYYNINFHPGPPEYPGIGCTNFALYNQEKSFGVTAHIMEPTPDTGRIIKVIRFPIYPEDDVKSLTERCYFHMIELAKEVVKEVFENNKISYSSEVWKRKPYKRKELNQLCEIKIDYDETEVKRRIRATYYPGMPGPYINLFGYIFEYKGERKDG